MFTGFICNFILACFLFLLFFGLFVLFLFSRQGGGGGMWGLRFCFLFLFFSFGLGWLVGVRAIIYIQTLKFLFRLAIQPGISCIHSTNIKNYSKPKRCTKQEIQRSSPLLKRSRSKQETQYSVVSPR